MLNVKPLLMSTAIIIAGLATASCASSGYGMSKTDSMKNSAEVMEDKAVSEAASEMDSMDMKSEGMDAMEDAMMEKDADVMMDSDTAMDAPAPIIEPDPVPEMIIEDVVPAPVTPIEPVICPEGTEPQPNGTCMLRE